MVVMKKDTVNEKPIMNMDIQRTVIRKHMEELANDICCVCQDTEDGIMKLVNTKYPLHYKENWLLAGMERRRKQNRNMLIGLLNEMEEGSADEDFLNYAAEQTVSIRNELEEGKKACAGMALRILNGIGFSDIPDKTDAPENMLGMTARGLSAKTDFLSEDYSVLQKWTEDLLLLSCIMYSPEQHEDRNVFSDAAYSENCHDIWILYGIREMCKEASAYFQDTTFADDQESGVEEQKIGRILYYEYGYKKALVYLHELTGRKFRKKTASEG